MGTHVSSPSFLKSKGTPVSEYMKVATSGAKSDLAFLFKVLSVNKALSIQAHPDSELAVKLNKEFPDIYKDPNHKPEMAIALTPFEALCGFLPQDKLLNSLEATPVFKTAAAIPAEHLASLKVKVLSGGSAKPELTAIFQDLFTLDANKAKLAAVIDSLIAHIKTIPETAQTVHQKLALRLHDQYSCDVGILVSFLMNYMTLQPGEALAICANEPHAYLSGDCMECMATSDNVVRCGLTPKLKDVKTLVSVCLL